MTPVFKLSFVDNPRERKKSVKKFPMGYRERDGRVRERKIGEKSERDLRSSWSCQEIAGKTSIFSNSFTVNITIRITVLTNKFVAFRYCSGFIFFGENRYS